MQEAFKALRGNAFINYKQLNNSCKLYAFDVSIETQSNIIIYLT